MIMFAILFDDSSGAEITDLGFDVLSCRGVLPAVDISAWWRFLWVT